MICPPQRAVWSWQCCVDVELLVLRRKWNTAHSSVIREIAQALDFLNSETSGGDVVQLVNAIAHILIWSGLAVIRRDLAQFLWRFAITAQGILW